jgi:hypothetical protein
MKKIILALIATVLVACGAQNTPPKSASDEFLIRELERERARADRAEMHMRQTDEALGHVLQEQRAANGEGNDPEPPPEKPAAAPSAPAQSFPGLQPQMAMVFNPHIGGFTTQQAGYMNLNPRGLPCQAMCVTVINATTAQTDIAVFVNMDITTVFSGFQPVVGAARLARTQDGQTVYGYISIRRTGSKWNSAWTTPAQAPSP